MAKTDSHSDGRHLWMPFSRASSPRFIPGPLFPQLLRSGVIAIRPGQPIAFDSLRRFTSQPNPPSNAVSKIAARGSGTAEGPEEADRSGASQSTKPPLVSPGPPVTIGPPVANPVLVLMVSIQLPPPARRTGHRSQTPERPCQRPPRLLLDRRNLPPVWPRQ